MSGPTFDPSGLDELFDVAVIGTGMGGSTVGYELARRGHRVLFLEKGLHLQAEGRVHPGSLTDQGTTPDDRLERGRWPEPLSGATGAGAVSFYAPLGCGTGGSTVLYAATLERFFPSDFRPREHFPEAGDANLPEAWPVSYEDLEPWYAEAERLFRVHGTSDPLHPASDDGMPAPPPLSDRDRAVEELFERRGFHPYRIHVGCEFKVDDCTGCGGVLCARACKSDAGRLCLAPALEQHGATLLTECEVLRLEADDASVQAIQCRWKGQARAFRARQVVLAAGAYMSPILLQNSRNEVWPEGLANRSGMVGRHLMVHAGDMIAVRPDRGGALEGFAKSLSVNDLYFAEGRKLGNLQSVGIQVSSGAVFAHLAGIVERSPGFWSRLVRPFMLRIAARIGAWFFRNSVVFGSILEDLPYPENRVEADPTAASGMRFSYRYPDELAERNAVFRRALSQRLGFSRVVSLTRGENLNWGHPCGTCRFGDDPEESVLDRNNRAHGIDNLWVVDASFFPSSGGTNPSLTIAANALRVAPVIDEALRKTEETR